MSSAAAKLGVRSGVGIVVSNMIGAGVFISAGFMAQDMGPGTVLLCWIVGAVIALAGARAYAAVAELVPRSGGEYRYLSELLHPFLGYLAGWGSLLLGFSAPIAVAGLAAGAFAQKLGLPLAPWKVGALVIVLLAALHSLNLRSSKVLQNTLVGANALLLALFVGVGLFFGKHEWPTWTPPHASGGFPLSAIMGSLFFVAFAFSGWNAVVYAAEDFREPRRSVPRSMLIGCSLVAVLYLVVNWIFVANITPDQATVVFQYDQQRVTLGHLITKSLIGDSGAAGMSILTIVAFASAMSAMTFAGPRTYAAMAKDGFLPRLFAGREGRPPVAAVWLQALIALFFTYYYQDNLSAVMGNVGAILTLFAALTTASLFKVRFFSPKRPGPRPGALALAAASVHVLFSAWMLYFGVRHTETHLLVWVGAVAVAAFAAYWGTLRWRRAVA